MYAAYPNIIKYMMDEKDATAIIERRRFADDTDSTSDDGYEESDDDE